MPAEKRIAKCSVLTNIKTAKTADTIWAIGVRRGVDSHRTYPLAGRTPSAALIIHRYLEKAGPVKQTPQAAQRACCPAKGPVDKKHQDKKKKQDSHLPSKHKPDLGPNIRVEKNERQTSLESASRANPLAKPGLPHAKFVNNKKGQQNDKNKQDKVTKISEETRQLKPSPAFPMH